MDCSQCQYSSCNEGCRAEMDRNVTAFVQGEKNGTLGVRVLDRMAGIMGNIADSIG